MTGLFSKAGSNVAGERRPRIAVRFSAVYCVGCGASCARGLSLGSHRSWLFATQSSSCCWIGLNVRGRSPQYSNINECFCRLLVVKSVSSCGRGRRAGCGKNVGERAECCPRAAYARSEKKDPTPGPITRSTALFILSSEYLRRKLALGAVSDGEREK